MSGGWIFEETVSFSLSQKHPVIVSYTCSQCFSSMGTLSSLLFLLLTVHSVNALKCYVCASTTSNQECNKNLQDCQAPLDTCMTTVGTLGSVTAIVKTCSPSKLCTSAAAGASVDSNGNGFQVTCCNSYLCNYSGAASITLHRWLLVLPLFLIILLFTQHT
ncbi:ly6/PLAUR domain-containing protein 2-like [Megalobrama amblycephala]|uniref:ly6/PLAUR domain-containing protein 2-like n=1 Tax=Megalobrama amblycephala TaxID=75352 RepID=UPI002013DA5D|nr:ly6/PLAUR domain-containing protein 2-like [Megalobrama amblycephala]